MSKLLHTSNTLACARPQITVFMYTTSYATVFVDACVSVASLLLQQCRYVDVPANGLSIKAAGEQVARLVLLIPRCATHHPSVPLRTHVQNS